MSTLFDSLSALAVAATSTLGNLDQGVGGYTPGDANAALDHIFSDFASGERGGSATGAFSLPVSVVGALVAASQGTRPAGGPAPLELAFAGVARAISRVVSLVRGEIGNSVHIRVPSVSFGSQTSSAVVLGRATSADAAVTFQQTDGQFLPVAGGPTAAIPGAQP